MAIISYKDHETVNPVGETLSELSQHARSTRAFMTMLGDYWTSYYRNSVDLGQAHTGAIAGVGRQLTELFELLLSGNVLDFPVEQGISFDLLVFDRNDFVPIYDSNGNLDSYYVSVEGCNLATVQYLTTSLFESAVILVNGEHFRCVEGDGIYFYVDIFEDPSIKTYEYTLADESTKKVLLWASPIVVHNYYLYERYGRFLYRKALDTYQYKWMITGLMRYFTGAKTCSNMEKVLDILFGVPYCRADEETILAIEYVDENLNDWTEERTEEASYIRITTDKRVYYTYALSVMDYGVGDVVHKNEMFAHFSKVLDYINCPYWWENEAWYFPQTAVDGGDEDLDGLTREEKNDMFDRILKYNTVYVNINVTYESWELYNAIVGSLYSIIDRGFPVYLNAHIEDIFRASFVDDTDFMPRTRDDWFEIFQHLWFYDEFCKIIRYNGFIHEHGFWRYGLWDHRDGRMLDFLDVCMEPIFRDPVLYPKECPLYDGEFFALGDIQHDCYGDTFAWDRWERHVHLNPRKFTDYVPHDDGWMTLEMRIPNYFDWFCEPKPYKGIRRYDGKTIHYLWGGIPGTRMTDPQRMNVNLPAIFDCVGGEPWYDGEHEHDGDIDHQPDRDFAKDIFYPIAVSGFKFADYVMGGPHYVGSHEHEGDIDHQPDRDFARDEFGMDGAWRLDYHDIFCAPYLYNLQAFYDGHTQYYLWRNTGNHRMTDEVRLEMRLPALFDCFGYKPWYDGEYEHGGEIDHQPDMDFASDDLHVHVSGYRFFDHVMGCPCYDDEYDHEGDIDHEPDMYFARDEFGSVMPVGLDLAELEQEFSDEVSLGTGYGFEDYSTELANDFVDEFVLVSDGGDDVQAASDEFEVVGYRNGEVVYF